jgi:hypothetical protein
VLVLELFAACRVALELFVPSCFPAPYARIEAGAIGARGMMTKSQVSKQALKILRLLLYLKGTACNMIISCLT